MEVRHHDHIDVFGPHAVGCELVHQDAPRGIGHIGGLGPHSAVDQDSPSLRAHQKGPQVKAHVLIGGEVPRILVPVLLWNGREKVTEIEFEGAIRQRHDLHIADANHMTGHRFSSPTLSLTTSRCRIVSQGLQSALAQQI
jgi:hypothetical protein